MDGTNKTFEWKKKKCCLLAFSFLPKCFYPFIDLSNYHNMNMYLQNKPTSTTKHPKDGHDKKVVGKGENAG